MNDYKPNSNRFKEEQKAAASKEKKQLQKVVKGAVKTKKKSEIHKLADVFISEDVNNVGSYILMDVLVPTIKKAIVDIVTDGVNMIFFGGTSGRRSSGSNASYVSYRSYSDRKDTRHESKPRSGYDYDNIFFDNRGDAEEVLTRMDEVIEQYGMVTVADLFDLVGKTCDYTANKYGWTNIRSASVVREREGYKLKLPRVLPIS